MILMVLHHHDILGVFMDCYLLIVLTGHSILIIRQHHIFIIGYRQLLLVLMLMLVPMLHHTIFFCFATFVFWFLCVGRYHSM